MGDGQLTREEVNEILRDLDPEGKNQFNYEEFVRSNFEFFNSIASQEL